MTHNTRKPKLYQTALLLLAASAMVIAAVVYHTELQWFARKLPLIKRFFRPTAAGEVAIYGAAARARLLPVFKEHGLPYPPDKVAFVAIKSSMQLMVYATAADGRYAYLRTYPILGASGHLGPKLRNGDLQVPEGIYKLTLEPDTPYHLALRLNYPNASDLARAQADGRTDPGSDILIHGTNGSVGCLAMGDPASEDLFVLVYDTKSKDVPLVIAPYDLRTHSEPGKQPTDPAWLPELHKEIKAALDHYPQPDSTEKGSDASMVH